MFATGAVEIRRDADAKVLSLGLGAGYINSYLHYNFPNMDITTVELDPAILRIAKKWYALDEDYRHRVIIDDGLNYVKCAAESGIQYEVVHLDICTTDPDAKSLCPIDIFFTEEAVRVLSKLISERGVVIVNVVSARYDSNVIANEIMSCTNVTRPDRLDVAYRKFAGYSIAD
uniref:PABS domain-containing protein n=1 Tax=Angiostrongylus cantonensis TaxID=6313 RepID=A0A0K0D380_ANGCA